jgi:purine-binding chemotaxis protein CheW
VIAPPTLLFRVGETTYGCDIGLTQEIVPLRPVTRLPGAPPSVRGLINVRGTIVTVLDLGARLEPARGPSATGSIVLVRQDERLVGVIVDEVLDVRVLPPDDDAETETGAGAITRRVATVDGSPVVILDLDALIAEVLLV